jgi:hypothetical protein
VPTSVSALRSIFVFAVVVSALVFAAPASCSALALPLEPAVSLVCGEVEVVSLLVEQLVVSAVVIAIAAGVKRRVIIVVPVLSPRLQCFWNRDPFR